MKLKIVIRVAADDNKSRSEAMKIAVSVPGVDSAALTGPDRNLVQVVGEGIDAVELTKRLRKKVAPAELVSVAEVKKEETKEAGKATQVVAPQVVAPPAGWSYGYSAPAAYSGYQYYPVIY